jgi:hypothetical protein
MTTFKNFAKSRVSTAPSPPTTGTTIIVDSGEGFNFPGGRFRAIVWPIGEVPTVSNAEIVYVTSRSTDTFTVVRQYEGSISRSIQVGDQIAATITAETVRDFRNLNRIVVDDNYVASLRDDLIVCNKTGDMTVSLPASIGQGRILEIKNINTGTVTVDGNGTDTLEGDLSIDIYEGESLRIADYITGKWVII